jgi:predicted unusual protein kinase regulating ubiquinone biosynthesis (AarF/ABC1/UbiB family)
MTAVAANHVVRDAGRRVSSVGKSPQEKEQARDKTVILLANQLTNVLGGMKGAAMKVGQMLSVLDMPYLPDEVAPQFQERLAVLRDQAPEIDAETMSAAVAHELGRPLDQVFARFGTGAVASASIGQVYRATLHDGREVAVKIKYPGIDDAVRADIKNLVAFLKFWRRKLPALGSKQLIAELRSTLASELDYVAEARNQASLASAYEGHPFIVVPRVVEGLSTDQMLVTEWFDGEPLASATTQPAQQRDRIGEIIYRFYIGSIYRIGEFSGDPHPGNVLLASDGRVGFVDFGSYKQIDADARAFELAVWRAGAAQDGDEVLRLAVTQGVFDGDTAISADKSLQYTLQAFGWQMVDDEVTMTRDRARGVMSVLDPRGESFTDMREQSLPAEILVSRRVDMLTAGMLGQLEATANWFRIAAEWVYDAEPVTALGRVEQQWREQRRRSGGSTQ